jgi:DNA-directed RNA polymerase specialized sigma24 family protein
MRSLTADVLCKHDKLIWGIAHKMAEYLQYKDVDELYSRSKEVLVNKMSQWDPKKGKFTTFAHIVLRNDLIDYVKRNRRLIPCSNSKDANGEIYDRFAELPDPRQSDALPSRIVDLEKGVSAAALEVVEIAKTMNFGDVFGPNPAIEKLRAELLRRGWDRRKTHIVFRELADEIRAW